MKIKSMHNPGKPQITISNQDTGEELASVFVNGNDVHIVFTRAGAPKDIQGLVLDEIRQQIDLITR